MKKHKMLSAFLAAVIICSCTISVAAAGTVSASITNFQRSAFYTEGQFSDVDEGEWYGAEQQAVIKTACELGIINGMGDGTFQPDKNLRICEAIKLAAVVHSLYKGDNTSFNVAKKPWYNDYVGYAILNGIISANAYANYEAYTTRSDMARIFAKALPAEAYSAINAVEGIIDVWTSRKISVSGYAEYADILLLYRAGVLTGDTDSHAFRPYENITRAEAAAIVTRVALTSERQRFTILPGHADNTMQGPAFTVYNSAGAALALGPQSWKQVQSFYGSETPAIRNTGSDDVMDALEADFLFGTVKYLASKFAPDTVYVWSVGIKDSGYRLGNGLRCGSTAQEILAVYGTQMRYCDYDIVYDTSHAVGYLDYKTGDEVKFDVSKFNGTLTYDPSYFSGVKLEDCPWPGIMFEITDGVVSAFGVGCAGN